MRIVVTGTPGTGKTSLAEKLSKKLKLRLVSLGDFAEKQGLVDEKQGVDVGVLKKKLRAFLGEEKNYVLEGHLACEFAFPADLVVVLRLKPSELKKRLESRKYTREKVVENLDCECLDYCGVLAKKNYPHVYELSSKGALEKILKWAKTGKLESEDFDFLEQTSVVG